MKCSKCIEYNWNSPQDAVVVDDDNAGYCLFHAPIDLNIFSKERVNNAVNAYIQAEVENNPIVSFVGAVFKYPLEISNISNMPSGLDFSHSTFFEDVKISNVKFDKELYFNNATTHRRLQLNSCSFNSEVSFVNSMPSHYGIELCHIDRMSISNIVFSIPEANFLKFVGVEWSTYPFTKMDNSLQHGELEVIYRSLKIASSASSDHESVSRWHYLEMTYKLKQVGCILRYPTTLVWWYWMSCGCSEKPARAVCALGILIVLFGIFSSYRDDMYLCIVSYGYNLQPVNSAINDFFYLIPFLGSIKIQPGVFKVVSLAMNILLTTQIALTLVSLKNKFKR